MRDLWEWNDHSKEYSPFEVGIGNSLKKTSSTPDDLFSVGGSLKNATMRTEKKAAMSRFRHQASTADKARGNIGSQSTYGRTYSAGGTGRKAASARLSVLIFYIIGFIIALIAIISTLAF